MKVAIIFAEFGRPAPDTSNVRRYFPDADIRVYMDDEIMDCFSGPRRGHRLNDYWKVQKLLVSGVDVAIAIDADMEIVSPDVRVLPVLAKKFGLCLPANPRKMVRIDAEIGADGAKVTDRTLGMGYAYNCSPIALDLRNKGAVECVKVFLDMMLSSPARGPLVWWRAVWETGFNPYLLPPQWCVCAEDVGIGNEIILHKGHNAVRSHYKIAC